MNDSWAIISRVGNFTRAVIPPMYVGEEVDRTPDVEKAKKFSSLEDAEEYMFLMTNIINNKIVQIGFATDIFKELGD